MNCYKEFKKECGIGIYETGKHNIKYIKWLENKIKKLEKEYLPDSYIAEIKKLKRELDSILDYGQKAINILKGSSGEYRKQNRMKING